MPLSSQTARVVVLAGLSKFTSSPLRVGQMEAAKVSNRCRDAQQSGDERAHPVAASGYASEAVQAGKSFAIWIRVALLGTLYRTRPEHCGRQILQKMQHRFLP